jgi:predicted transcriptional regulator
MQTTVKEQVRRLADTLPDDATWDQVRYEIYVREKIAAGEAAIAAGRTLPHDEVERRFAGE